MPKKIRRLDAYAVDILVGVGKDLIIFRDLATPDRTLTPELVAA